MLKVLGQRQLAYWICSPSSYVTLCRVMKGEGSEEEEWHPTSGTPLVQFGSRSNSHFPHMLLANGNLLKSSYLSKIFIESTLCVASHH